jgi:holin-like protein
MIQGIGILLGFQLMGEVIARLLHVPIPGSIIGLLLLFAWLRVRTFRHVSNPESIDATEVAQVATPLLRNLAILFVAPGVGVMQYLDLFWQHGPTVLLVLVASTLATMAATAAAFSGSQSLGGWLRAVRSRNLHINECSPSELRQPVESSVASLDRRNG